MSLSLARGVVFGLAVAAAFVGDGCVVAPDRPREDPMELEGPTRVVVRGAPVVLEEGQVEDGNLVVVGGTVRVDGTVRGSLVAVGGRLELGPAARVERDLIGVANRHQEVAPGARVEGSEVLVNLPGVASLLERMLSAWDRPLLVLLAGMATLGLLGWAAWRRVVRRWDDARFDDVLARRPVRAGLIGLGLHGAAWVVGWAAVLSGWLAGVGLAVWLAAALAWLVGWAMCGAYLGRRLARQRGWGGSPARHVLAGVGLWLLASLVPVFGWLAASLGSLAALGALVSRRDGVPAAPVDAPVPEALPAAG
ncbi:MAG: polymer-forming cytoskeletal protein [Deltaproteobacteria bacterium]|nr:polymer-forming cytoskeletal protein [Deltaproteobacteria bacterium]